MSDHPRDINRDIADAEALYDSDPGEEHAVSCDCDEFPWHACPVHGDLDRLAAVSHEYEAFAAEETRRLIEQGVLRAVDYDDDDGIRNGHDRPEEVRGER